MSRGYPSPGEKLDRARVRRGWSVTEVAEVSGLSVATVSRALAGRRVSTHTLFALGAAFRKHPPRPEVQAVLDEEVL